MVTDPAVATALALAVPESLVAPFEELADAVVHADAIVVGPGLAGPDVAGGLLAQLLGCVEPHVPLVLDAAAIPAAARCSPAQLDGRPLVLTPNREELHALVDANGDGAVALAAQRFGAVVVCFGEVACPDGTSYVDDEGVRGLGTSGAGDVLAGAVGGLAARTGDAAAAGCWAALAHRRAAERLAERIAPAGYLARELADELPAALAALVTG